VSAKSKKNRDEGAEASPDDLSLEERLRRLDRIVATLEGGEVELEQGLELFEEGVGHIRAAEALLSRAELRVEELIGEVESLEVRPFQEGSEE
jgi:exodeoxyribonuclease VII small subunit